jgi:hypothetical protein
MIRDKWYELTDRLNNISLNDENDVTIWKWTSSKKFIVKSVYEHLTKEDYGSGYKRVWKEKMLEKIKIFMWLMEERSNLTKDNMLKRNWQSDPCCYFYDEPEDTDHLFF